MRRQISYHTHSHNSLAQCIEPIGGARAYEIWIERGHREGQAESTGWPLKRNIEAAAFDFYFAGGGDIQTKRQRIELSHAAAKSGNPASCPFKPLVAAQMEPTYRLTIVSKSCPCLFYRALTMLRWAPRIEHRLRIAA